MLLESPFTAQSAPDLKILLSPFDLVSYRAGVVKRDSARTVHPFECSAPARFDPENLERD